MHSHHPTTTTTTLAHRKLSSIKLVSGAKKVGTTVVDSSELHVF